MESSVINKLSEFEQEAKSLLKSRADTLSLYKQIMTYQPFEESELLRDILEDFCEQLVDYSGKVHFTILNYIQENCSENQILIDSSNKISALLVQNTQTILDFQDAYNSDVVKADVEHLNQRLNQLGEIIADRIGFEDQLLNMVES